MYDAVSIEERNKPVVALANKDFVNDAMSAASSRLMPTVRIVPTSVPCECSVMEQVESGIDAAMVNIVAALTRPLTAEEASPQPKELEKPSGVIFKGDLDDVNRFFYKRGWTDGLPIIPPTEEKVAEMLTGTDLPPDYLVAEMVPRRGKATIERIAINAVMAGCLPTYMPVLIAGVQALTDPRWDPSVSTVSTGSWAPFWIINGPIRHALHINSGWGALSPGDIANAAIGRAMSLITKNIRGVRKAVEDMGCLGNACKYSQVIAENEEGSPWEPLHVEQGFKKEDSAVTVFFPNSSSQMWAYGSDDEGILRTVIYNLIPGRRGRFCLVLTPPHAKILASKGWTKKDIKAFIADYGRVPAYRMPGYWRVNQGEPAGLYKDRIPMNNTDAVSVLNDPRLIKVLVAGGDGAIVGQFVGAYPDHLAVEADAMWITRKAELPANWDKLVQKYKDIVPTYVRY
ncbi:MAG: hypothetical protein HY667_01060 [Chloroflexi bacterium]|nr:hypothetical protein [Chloroflexota bacterium]